MKVEDIFYEMIEEAQEGNVVIDGDPFNIAFNTIMPGKELIKDENLPILNIFGNC